MRDPAIDDQLHIRQGFVGAYRLQRKCSHLTAGEFQLALAVQALSQTGGVLQTQIHQYAAAVALHIRVDALHLGVKRFVAAFQCQLRLLTDAHIHGVGRAERGFEFQAAEVDDVQQFLVDGHTFAGLRQTRGNLPADGREQHGFIHGFARHIGSGDRGVVGGARAAQRGFGGFECGLGNKALVDQGFVVVVLA